MSERIKSGGYFWDGGADSCLVLPGLSGAEKARRLGDEIHLSGFSVSMPLLTYCLETSDNLPPSNWGTWLDDAREAYTRLDRKMASVAVAGIGVGGALALVLAAEYPVSAVVAIAPTLRMPGMLGFWGSPPDCEGGTGNVRMRDIRAVARLARRSLFAVVAPALIVEPVKGGFVHPGSATRAYADVSSREKRIEWLERSRREFPGDAEFRQALAAIRNHLRPSSDQKRL
jgi:carboxylesterase